MQWEKMTASSRTAEDTEARSVLREVPLFMDLTPVHVLVTKEHLDGAWYDHIVMLLRLISFSPVRIL